MSSNLSKKMDIKDVLALAHDSYQNFAQQQASAEANQREAAEREAADALREGRERFQHAIGEELYQALDVVQVAKDSFTFMIEDMRWNIGYMTDRNTQIWRVNCWRIDPEHLTSDGDPTDKRAVKDHLFRNDVRSHGDWLELRQPLLVAIGAVPLERERLAQVAAEEARCILLIEARNQQIEAEEREQLAEQMRVDNEIKREIEAVKADTAAALWQWKDGEVVPYFRLTYLKGAWRDQEDGADYDYETVWTLTDRLTPEGYIQTYSYGKPRTIKLDVERSLPVFERFVAFSVADLPSQLTNEVYVSVAGIVWQYSDLLVRYGKGDSSSLSKYLYARDKAGKIHVSVGTVACQWVQDWIEVGNSNWKAVPLPANADTRGDDF